MGRTFETTPSRSAVEEIQMAKFSGSTRLNVTGPVGNFSEASALFTHERSRAAGTPRHLTAHDVRQDSGTHATRVRATINTRR